MTNEPTEIPGSEINSMSRAAEGLIRVTAEYLKMPLPGVEDSTPTSLGLTDEEAQKLRNGGLTDEEVRRIQLRRPQDDNLPAPSGGPSR